MNVQYYGIIGTQEQIHIQIDIQIDIHNDSFTHTHTQKKETRLTANADFNLALAFAPLALKVGTEFAMVDLFELINVAAEVPTENNVIHTNSSDTIAWRRGRG